MCDVCKFVYHTCRLAKTYTEVRWLLTKSTVPYIVNSSTDAFVNLWHVQMSKCITSITIPLPMCNRCRSRTAKSVRRIGHKSCWHSLEGGKDCILRFLFLFVCSQFSRLLELLSYGRQFNGQGDISAMYLCIIGYALNFGKKAIVCCCSLHDFCL